VKQLQNEINSLKSKLGNMVTTRPKMRKSNRNRVNRNQASYQKTATEIPMEIAYTVKQTSRQKIHTESASEYMGSFTITPTTPIGTTTAFFLNPLGMTGSRLQKLASVYQKYRFKKFSLTLQSSSTTAINGLYILGYSSNPDYELPPGNEINAIYALPGATSANVWRTVTSHAKLINQNKWFEIDADSREIMDTTQGVFFLAIQSPLSMSTSVSLPIIIDYTIEFTGSAIQNVSSNPIQIWPAGVFSYNSLTANYTFTAATGEPAIPETGNGNPYFVNPSWIVDALSGPETMNAYIRVMVPTTASYNFYESLEDFHLNEPIVINSTFAVNRTTIQTAPNLN